MVVKIPPFYPAAQPPKADTSPPDFSFLLSAFLLFPPGPVVRGP